MSSVSKSFNKKMPLYIPRVDTRALPRINPIGSEAYLSDAKEFIAKQFRFQKIGEVDRVDLVPKKTPDGYMFYIAFIHFNTWFDAAPAVALQQMISEGKEKATLQYHKDWYWIVTENRKPRSAEEVDLRKVVEAQKKEIEALTQMIGSVWGAGQASEDDVTDSSCLTAGGIKPPVKLDWSVDEEEAEK